MGAVGVGQQRHGACRRDGVSDADSPRAAAGGYDLSARMGTSSPSRQDESATLPNFEPNLVVHETAGGLTWRPEH